MSIDAKQVERSLKDGDSDGDSLGDSLSNLLENLTSDEAIRLLSELDDEEISHITAILAVDGEEEVTQDLVQQFLSLKVSRNRRGRKELTEVADAFSGVFQVEEGGLTDKVRSKMGV